MQLVSELMREKRPLKPDADSCSHWLVSPVTQHHLNKLKIAHQDALEELLSVNFGDTDKDLKAFYGIQYGAEVLKTLIDEIEEMGAENER
ncbi:MAG: hypothetical protein KAR08_12250 [Candidatus Heimdallarchaeota archaeon]|nr:hypothetical protein [Candidatus Heimdallarchaeota archaeon]